MKLKHQVSLSVVLMTTFGLFAAFAITYMLHGRYLENTALDRLQALSAVQTARLAESIESQYDRVALITSRTRLRTLLQEYQAGQATKEEATKGLTRILADSMLAVDGIKQLLLFNARRDLITAVNHPDFEGKFNAAASCSAFEPLDVQLIHMELLLLVLLQLLKIMPLDVVLELHQMQPFLPVLPWEQAPWVLHTA